MIKLEIPKPTMFSKIKTRKIWRTASLPLIDFVSLLIAGAFAYLFRYHWFDYAFTEAKRIYGVQYLFWLLAFCVFLVIFFAFFGVYKIEINNNWHKPLSKLVIHNFVGWMLVIAVLFFLEPNLTILPQGIGVSRFILLTGVLFSAIFLLLGRIILHLFELILYSQGIGQTEVLVVGAKTQLMDTHFSKDKSIGLVRYFDLLDKNCLEIIKRLITNGNLSQIYICQNSSSANPQYEIELAKLAERNKISFLFFPGSLGYFQAFAFKPFYVEDILYLELIHSKLDGWQSVLKRMFDIIFASFALFLLSPLFLVIAIAIKLDSKGPIFYLSERVGPDGKIFKVWKFRRLKTEFSTSSDNQQALELENQLISQKDIRGDGILYKIKDDPRSTKIGKFLEKTSLDELPQFINVLIGNMSIVGPRPHQPREVAKYAEHHYKVLNIKPGITGLAQINGRSDLKFEDEVKFDTHYLENWNFWLDLFIIIQTPLVILFKKHKG